MKKIIIAFFVALAVFFSIVLPIGLLSKTDDSDFKVAMVTDFSDVNDASFNQLCYELIFGSRTQSLTLNDAHEINIFFVY